MSYYDGLTSDVTALLTELGATVSFTRPTEGGNYNPSTGKIEGGAPLTLNGLGVVCRYTFAEIAGVSGVDGVNIIASDRKMVYQGDPVEVGDVYRGVSRVMHVGTIDPDESGAILYIVQLRG